MPYKNLSATELVRACVDSSDREAWREFVTRFQPTIAGVALRTARRWGQSSPPVLEDLVQEIFLKLCGECCRLLREFEPRHEEAFYSYLKVVSARVVHDYFKRLHAVKRRPADRPQRQERDDDPPDLVDAVATERIERGALFAEIEQRFGNLDLGPSAERDRRIFGLYYRAGMSARAIAQLPGIGLSVKGVESTIFRVTRLLRQELAGSRQESPDSHEEGESAARDADTGKGTDSNERSK